MDTNIALLLNYAVILMVVFVSMTMKRDKPVYTQVYMWICALGIVACVLEAISYMHMPVWFPMPLYRTLMLLDYTIGDLVIISFIYYTYLYISARTSINRKFFTIPMMLLAMGMVLTLADALQGKVFSIVDRTCIETSGKSIITYTMEMLVIPYLIFLTLSKREQIGIQAVIILGFFGIIPQMALAYYLISGKDYSFVGSASGLLIMYIFLENKLAQERERDQRIRAEAANRAKTRFFFNMSHDIRTPMNAIVGYTELIGKNLHDEQKVKDYLGKMVSSSRYLLGLINNVLEMSRIENGKVTIEEKPCNIADLEKEIRSICGDSVLNKGINCQVVTDGLAKAIYCDRTRLLQIYVNIISNAVKYTPEGGTILVDVKHTPADQEGYVAATIRVTDSGIGMSPEYLPRVFDAFERETSYTDNKIEGSGLGLSIVKKLVELMGGTITAESELGKGSTFTVQLKHRIADECPEPILDTASQDADNAEEIIIKGKRILLAEDNELNAEIAMEILTAAGLYVEWAQDGRECVDMMDEAEPGYYDLVLMDVQMPRMDGYEATRRIRIMKNITKANIPIYAMTANAFAEDRQNALDAGMDGHLSKPLDIPVFMNVLKKALR